MQKISIVLLFFFSYFTATSQKLDHVLGDIIVHVNEDRNISQLVRELGTHSVEMRNLSVQKITNEPFNLWLIKSDPSTLNESDLLEKIFFNQNVISAQFNHLIEYRSTIPNDPEFVNQWQYINDGTNNGKLDADLDIDQAWDFTTGGLTATGDTIVACIIDDGVFENHEDLQDRLWVNRAEIPNNNIDDDNNGYIDDYLGWDFEKNNDHGIFDDGGHGTPVAAIVGAHGNNEIGVSGVNWDIKLMIVHGGGNEAQSLAAYEYPYIFRKKYNETNGAEGAFVVTTNASWGTSNIQPEDNPIWCGIYDKLGAVGILNCGATSNSNVDIDIVGDFPTACPSDYLIAVTNINKRDEKVPSGYGKKTIDLGTYGEGVWTAKRNNTYDTFGGTSGATPHVTGTIALLYAMPCVAFADFARTNPDLAARFIKHVILEGVEKIPSLEGLTVTGGKLNIYNSLLNALELCSNTTYPFIATFSNFTLNGADMMWTVPNGGLKTNMRYRLDGTSSWTNVANITSVYHFDNLIACETYEVQLQTEYNGGIKSKYSYSYKFTTKGCCEAPLNLSYQELSNTQSVRISWTAYEEANTYHLQYKKQEDSNWNDITANSNQYTIENIEYCVPYICRIQSNCEFNQSNYSNSITFTSECGACTNSSYCDINSAGNTFEWIDQIELNTLNNESGADPNGYGKHLGTHISELQFGDTYNLKIIPNWSSDIYNEHYKVWIDFNMNFIFEEEEIIFNTEIATNSPIDTNIEIPENLSPGITRMRVVMSYNQILNSCDNIEYGEYEDYCVNLVRNTSSVITENNVESIHVFPNPFINHIQVVTQYFSEQQLELSIHNLNGTRVYSSLLSNQANIVNYNDLDHLGILNSGIYFLTIKTKNKIISYKLVKL